MSKKWLWSVSKTSRPIRAITCFLIIISCYHFIVIGATFFWWVDIVADLAISRDLLWMILCLIVLTRTIRTQRDDIRAFLSDWGYEILLLVSLMTRSVWLSMFQWVSLTDMIIGYKYDLHFLWILLSAIFLWYILTHHKDTVSHITTSYWKIILTMVGGWLAYQLIKMWAPWFFELWWYGPIGDYSVGGAPPLRYRTGPWGVARLQGLFFWPNNYGYFLGGIFSVVLCTCVAVYRWGKLKSPLSWKERGWRRGVLATKLLAWVFFLIYLLSLLWTLSRGAYVSVIMQCLIRAAYIYRKHLRHTDGVPSLHIRKKMIVWAAVCLWVLFFGWVSLSWVKAWSTSAHILARQEWREAFLINPLWYGLGSSWPSVHHQWVYLPESQYFQIVLDLWIVWILIWMIIWMWFLKPVFQYLWHAHHKHDRREVPMFVMLWVGIIGILVEWLFLHVREDSMVNYLLLVPYGMTMGRYMRDRMSKVEMHK